MAPGTPYQPQLEDIVVSSTLNGLVSGVVSHVIMFVLLEEVGGTGGIARFQKSLGRGRSLGMNE